MNPPKVSDEDDIQFLIATPKVCSATEAARVQPEEVNAPQHAAFTRLLHGLQPKAQALWKEAAAQVERQGGVLVVDDSTLHKPSAEKMALVQRHWSGKHHAVVAGLNLITLLWSKGDRHVPLDYRVYDKVGDALTKNDHFRTRLDTAHTRRFVPECVVFDSGYSSLETLKPIWDGDWTWRTRLKAHRLVNPDATGNRPVAQVETDTHSTLVHLKGYGLIRRFLIVAPDGDREYGATNDPNMKALTRVRFAGYAWIIETDHRGIKQYCSIERAQVRAARAQRNHIHLAVRAFLRREWPCYQTGLSWFEVKLPLIRPALGAYLAKSLYTLPTTA